jgi:hypothetical protein
MTDTRSTKCGVKVMIELTKSSRIAFEALQEKDKKKLIRLYHHFENEPETFFKSYKAKQLPRFDNTYVLNISAQLRAIAKFLEGKLIILEVVKHDTIKKMFSSKKG